MDTLDRVMEEGFSIPRTPRGSSLLRACSGLLSSGSKDVMYDEESVLQFFCMANAALRAKTEANAALQQEAAEARAELEEKRAKLIKALGKEKTLLLDCAFLQEQMEQLLTERSSFQEQISTLERENKFLQAERELMGSQLQSAAEEAGSGPGGEALALLELGEAGEFDGAGGAAAEAEADRQRALEAGTAAKLLRAEGDFAAAKADWEERESALLRSLEAASFAHRHALAAAAPLRTPGSAPQRPRASPPGDEASGKARHGDGGAARPASAAAELGRASPPPDTAGAECIVSCAPAAGGAALKLLVHSPPIGGGVGGAGSGGVGAACGEQAAGGAAAPAHQTLALNLDVTRLRKVQAEARASPGSPLSVCRPCR